MAWDLATAKKYLGITDDSQDDEIQAVMDTTLAAVEAVLQRGILLQANMLQTFRKTHTARLLLDRYPVPTVNAIDGDAITELPDGWYLDTRRGWIDLPAWQYIDTMVIDYDGGYDPLPADLERAMWEAFVQLWADTDATTGAPEGGTGVDLEGGGAVSRVTVQDFGSVTLDTGVSLAGDGAAKTVQRTQDWGWLHPWASTLQLYRSEHGVGVGFA